ncbi:hypothetical protein [Rhizobium metallidurans]|uniref:Uncharacterized protein n=1 Tax=Rhizobium metallidurans TaxID=1265931 RepID=A0A7W6GCI8_9HYPH|nr:hypothetical protein [Rhizobium metallidurans]MBB3966833.1 hypothetical protein [Rhizobium metallidurans]
MRKPAPKTTHHDADGTETEDNRQLVNRLLENAQREVRGEAQVVADETPKARHSVLEIALLVCFIPFYWLYSLATRRTADEYESL